MYLSFTRSESSQKASSVLSPPAETETETETETERGTEKLRAMVRTYTFAAMVGVAYVAVSSLDSVFEWMANRQEKKV